MTRLWGSRLLNVTALALGACHAGGDSSRTLADSSPDSGAGARVEATVATPNAPVAVCESVAVLWRATGRASVKVSDTLARVQTADTVDRNRGRFFTNIQGCAASADAATGLDSAQHAALYWAASADRGWVDLGDLDADGPDGNTRTRQRGKIQCQSEQSYDGGDDADSSYVPSPRFREVTICWRTGP
jgi:hypothetical protein